MVIPNAFVFTSGGHDMHSVSYGRCFVASWWAVRFDTHCACLLSYRDAIRVFLVNMSFKDEEEHREAKHVIFKVMSNRVQSLLQLAQWKEVRLAYPAHIARRISLMQTFSSGSYIM